MQTKYIPASNHHRLVAFGIDLFSIVLMQAIFGNATLWFYKFACAKYGVQADYDVGMFLSQFTGAFFFIGYFTISVGLFGNTIGKNFLKIKTYKANSNESLTMPQAYWRSMAYLMSSWTYMIGFILPWFREDKLALHDLLCGTRVVKQVPIEVSSELLHEHLQLAGVHLNEIPPMALVPSKARTGTDL